MKKLYLVEDMPALIDLVNFFKNNKKVDIKYTTFKSLQDLKNSFRVEKFQIVIDISRNPNYILVYNGLKKIFAEKTSYIYMIVNREQFYQLRQERGSDKYLILPNNPESLKQIIKIAEGLL